MSDVEKTASIPLDDEGFLRRECPYCTREFKVFVPNEERDSENEEEEYLGSGSEAESDEEQDDDSSEDRYCPYCGQTAPHDHWWSQQQLDYLEVVQHNIATEMMEKAFGGRRKSNGLISIEIDAKKLPEWSEPEQNDMMHFELKCCETKMKFVEEWEGNLVCHYCGFKHTRRNEA